MAFEALEWIDSESDDEWFASESDDEWLVSESDDEWIVAETLDDEAIAFDSYAALRPALNASWRECSPEQIEALLESVTRGMTIAEAESFWKSVANIGRQIAPVAGQVLSVAAPIVGGAIGGPAGAVIGNVAGRFAGQALGSLGGRPAARPPQPLAIPPTPVVQPMPTPIPTPTPEPAPPPTATPPAATTAAPLPGGTSATAQLLSFLQNPQLLQSILGQLLGSAGQSTQQVGAGGASAPFAAFMNALGVLANQAGSEAAEGEASDYLYDSEGDLLGDPASPEERATALLEQLRSAPAW